MLKSSSRERAAATMSELEAVRKIFRGELAAVERPQHFSSRVGVVLSGGGARGAYEAGVLLAFQDGNVPTHIVTAASIGSINAASFAAHSEGLVGKAENLVEGWMELTPATLGIDWSRYIFLLAGLIAASAGIANFAWEWFKERGIYLHAHHPKATWLALACAGIAILLFSDKLSYVGYVAWNLLRRRRWDPDLRKIWVSFSANVLVWGFIVIFLAFTHIHLPWRGERIVELSAPLPAILVIGAAFGFYRIFRQPLSRLSHRFLRLPLRTGLFPNYDRARFLRGRIPEDRLRHSDIRVIMTATDIQHGTARFFSNAPADVLAADPAVQADFVRREVEQPSDLVQAAVASSSFTFAYEAVPMDGRLWTDGGIMSNQPILPALRLGADVLFLVLISPLAASDNSGEIKTFLDVGLQAVDILISKNLKSDIALLNNFNRLCSIYARELGVKPEQLELEIGRQRYRYVKSFTIAPEKPLPVAELDFDAEVIGPLIVQGYKDAATVIREFLKYELTRPPRESRRVVHLSAERPEGNFHTARKS
jgi:predicted acylesterase/phospholipase RssA